MKTFKQFLSEGVISTWTANNLLTPDAINTLNAHCKDGLNAIKNKSVLYRGDNSFTGDFVELDLSDMARTSRDTNNLYQLMMDNSSALAGLPSRSKSMICSTSADTSKGYSTNVYAIIPFDSTKIAVGHVDDFPETVLKSGIFKGISLSSLTYCFGGTPFGGLNATFLSILNANVGRNSAGRFIDIKQIDEALSKATPEEMFMALHSGAGNLQPINGLLTYSDFPDSYNKTFDSFNSRPTAVKLTSLANYVKTAKLPNASQTLLNYFRALPKDRRFSAISSDVMTPENLSIESVKYGDPIRDNREVWFSGKAIAIKLSVFEDLEKQLKKQNG
jgi:hypothetical protein